MSRRPGRAHLESTGRHPRLLGSAGPAAGEIPGPDSTDDRSTQFSTPGDRTQAYYDTQAEAYASATQGADLRVLWEPFGAALERGALVADLGCGGGRDLLHFSEAGLAPIGLDRSFPLCRIARSFSRRPVVTADLIALPFRTGSFDAVWCVATLVHLSPHDARLALGEMRRVLRPCGVALLTLKESATGIPSARMMSRTEVGAEAEPTVQTDERGRQIVQYSEAAARALLEAARFTDVSLIRSVEHRSRGPVSWLAFLARRSA